MSIATKLEKLLNSTRDNEKKTNCKMIKLTREKNRIKH